MRTNRVAFASRAGVAVFAGSALTAMATHGGLHTLAYIPPDWWRVLMR